MTKLTKILLLGNPKLHEVSEEVSRDEIAGLKGAITELSDILNEFKATYNAGRAVAAPQIGVMKRIIFMNIDRPVIMFNPVLLDLSEEMMELWDDCMCFPNLLVKVKRHKSFKLKFRDENWLEQEWLLEDSLSELIQHEYDHLDGILATQRAIDSKSFSWRN